LLRSSVWRKKADNVAKLLNAEGNVDPKYIADLIQKEVAIQRNDGQKKIKSLEAKVRNQNIGNNSTTKKQQAGPRWRRKEKENNQSLPYPSKEPLSLEYETFGERKGPGILQNPHSGRGADYRNNDS
jgi:hypothetical protein